MPAVIPAVAFFTSLAIGAPIVALKIAGVFLLNLAASKLFGPKVPSGVGLGDMRGLQVMGRSALEFRKIVYGQAMLSGPIVYNNVSGTDNEYLWYVVALAHGQSEDLVSVWFDGDQIPKASIDWTAGTGASDGIGTGDVSTAKWIGDNSTKAVQIFYYLGDDDQPAAGDLVAAVPEWTTAHRLRGVTYLVVRLLYNEDTENVWKQGPPNNIKAVIKSRQIYDPRLDSTQIIDPTTSPITFGSGAHRANDSTTWEWSDNPALCIADYLFNFMGVDPAASIDWPAFANAADDCDVLVVVPPAASPENTETRFTCNGVLSLGQTHKNNLDALMSSCDGKLSYSAGVWKLRASVWEASSVAITANDLAGPIEVRGSAPKSERFNTVRGFFIDPFRKYEAAEFPHITSSTFVTRDNGETIEYDLALPMTNTETMAQRIGIRGLFQGDNQTLAILNMNVRGAKVTVGDVVTVDLPELGWTDGGNLLLQSEDFSTNWPQVDTIVTNDAMSPSGTLAADKLIELAATQNFCRQVHTASIVADDVYSGSVYAKLTGSNEGDARIDLSVARDGAGSFEETRAIFTLTSEWQRLTTTHTFLGNQTGVALLITSRTSGPSEVHLWGGQLVAGTNPGIYTRTTSAAVTTTPKTFRCIEWGRNADSSFKVTLKEDESASYDDPIVADYTTGNIGAVTVPADVIPPPSSLTATGVPVGIRLDWTNPPVETYDFIEVYEDTNDSWAGATLIAEVRADTLTVAHDSGTSYFYWIRAVKDPDLESLRDPDSDTTTITAAGTAGADGTDGVLHYLTNEAHVLASNFDGLGYSLTGSGGTHKVFEGTTDETTNATHEIVGGTAASPIVNWTKVQNGLTMTMVGATGVYSLSGAAWTTDAEVFNLRAVFNAVNYDKTYVIAKARQGSDGGCSVDTLTTISLSDVGANPTATCGFRVDNNGDIFVRANNPSGYSSKETWIGACANSDYECIFNHTGDALTGGSAAVDTWLVCSTDRLFELDTSGAAKSCSGTVQIRRASDSVVVGTAAVSLTVETSV